MKKVLLGVVIGLVLGAGSTLTAGEFGWTDTAKLERVAVAAEAILTELRSLREDLKARKIGVGN